MKQLLTKLAKFLMIPIGALYTLFKPASNIKILMYHRVNDSVKKELSVKSNDFRWQMEYLKKSGYHVISLDEAINCLAELDRLYTKIIILTFDDGYEDFYHNAYPILQEYGYTAIVYIVPGYIEANKVFWWDQDIRKSNLMNWEQIKSIKGDGIVDIGSHTMSHPDLNHLNPEDIAQELQLSRQVLEQRLDCRIRHFAYPRGIVTQQAIQAAQQIYDTAVSIFDGYPLSPESGFNKMQLLRLPVQRSDGRALFHARLNGWLAPEGWLKNALGRS